jgi:hypothetical protein
MAHAITSTGVVGRKRLSMLHFGNDRREINVEKAGYPGKLTCRLMDKLLVLDP